MTNKEISAIFKLTSQLMDLHGENSFRAKSYANSSFQIGRLDRQISTLAPEQYAELKGVGKSNAEKIARLLTTGSFPLLDELIAKTPEGLLEILKIKGLGAKKVRTIWKDLEIENIGELYYACVENRLSKMKGFGEKTQDSVKASIEFYMSSKKKFLFAKVEKDAMNLLDFFKQSNAFSKASLTGAIRRKSEIIESIDLIVVPIDGKLSDLITSANILTDLNLNGDKIHGTSENGFPVQIIESNKENYYADLFRTTGSKKFIQFIESKTGGLSKVENEELIFEECNFPYIVPELREDENEFDDKFLKDVQQLIEYEDIRGIIHNHSTYSDGANTVKEMAQACIDMGYEYFGINDHSKSAFYAGGLSEEAIMKQQKEVDALNKELAPFRIFKGIESDILNDGSLDYDDTVLASFDFIVASVHSNLKMDEDKAMKRLITAIENPYTTILGHMTGRLLLSRPGYPVNHKKIIDACSQNGVIIELNANPHRLDIDWRWLRYAMEKKVMISINPDAHIVDGIKDTYFGVCAARKGGLTKSMTFNALSGEEMANYFKRLKP